MYKIDSTKKLPYLAQAVSFSIPTSGKKIHIVEIYADGIVSTICGSGKNTAGQTWRRSTGYQTSDFNTVTSNELCSKCIKSGYASEVLA